GDHGTGPVAETTGDRVVETDDPDGAGERTEFGLDVVLDAAVPVEMVLGDVEHDAGLGPNRGRPVQLEGRQLDGEYVGPRFVAAQGVGHGKTEVAARDAAEAGGLEDRVQHHGRSGLAVRPGDGQPPTGRSVDLGAVDAPGQFDVAPDGD